MNIKFIGSPNYTESRQGQKIEFIICHWIVGKLSVADIVFQDTQRDTSSHYGIGDNEIHQYVKDSDTAYQAGDWNINLRSIGIEHQGGPDLPISDETYDTSARLIAELCQRYNIPLDRQHILEHREIIATQCPGTLDVVRLINKAKDLNKPLPPSFTDQTKIPKELLGTDEDKEIQQIRGLLGDLKNCQIQLKECQDKPISVPDASVMAPKTSPIDDSDLPPGKTFQNAPIIQSLIDFIKRLFKK